MRRICATASMRWDTLAPRPRGVSTGPPRLDVAYAHARSARPRREPRIRRSARPQPHRDDPRARAKGAWPPLSGSSRISPRCPRCRDGCFTDKAAASAGVPAPRVPRDRESTRHPPELSQFGDPDDPGDPARHAVGLARARVCAFGAGAADHCPPSRAPRPSPGSTAVLATLEPPATITPPGQGSSSGCDLHGRASGRESRMRRSGSSRLRSLTHLESRSPEAKRWAGLPGEGTNRTEWLNRHAASLGGTSVAWNAKGCVRASRRI